MTPTDPRVLAGHLRDFADFFDGGEKIWEGPRISETLRQAAAALTASPSAIDARMMEVLKRIVTEFNDSRLQFAGQPIPICNSSIDYAYAVLTEAEAAMGRASVIDEIAAERRRQVEIEGWTTEHDDWHTDGSMAQVAACYADPDPPMSAASNYPYRGTHPIPQRWPESWGWDWWKPKDRRRDLIRAAALIVAEIERLDRLPAAPAPEESET